MLKSVLTPYHLCVLANLKARDTAWRPMGDDVNMYGMTDFTSVHSLIFSNLKM